MTTYSSITAVAAMLAITTALGSEPAELKELRAQYEQQLRRLKERYVSALSRAQMTDPDSEKQYADEIFRVNPKRLNQVSRGNPGDRIGWQFSDYNVRTTKEGDKALLIGIADSLDERRNKRTTEIHINKDDLPDGVMMFAWSQWQHEDTMEIITKERDGIGLTHFVNLEIVNGDKMRLVAVGLQIHGAKGELILDVYASHGPREPYQDKK